MFSRSWRYHQCSRFLPQPLLVVCWYSFLHQNLGIFFLSFFFSWQFNFFFLFPKKNYSFLRKTSLVQFFFDLSTSFSHKPESFSFSFNLFNLIFFLQDLDSKSVVAELNKNTPDFFMNRSPGMTANPECVSLAWSADGKTLYAGYTDNMIRVWGV